MYVVSMPRRRNWGADMTWIQKLAETYDRCAGALQPVSHTTQQAHLEIVLDGQGRFRRASVVPKEDCTTLVPCTEESGGRSGNKPEIGRAHV